MRISVINWSRRRVGGAESYIESVISELVRRKNEISLFYEVDLPLERARMSLPPEVKEWNVSAIGSERALRELRQWRPDVLYAQGLSNFHLEAQTIEVAPTVFRAHNYYGSCISGTKTQKFPVITPCDRTFGLPCLVHYYPRRCGGLSPFTMLREYRRQTQRLKNLRNCRMIVANSSRIKAEYVAEGFEPKRLYNLSPYTQEINSDHGLPDDLFRQLHEVKGTGGNGLNLKMGRVSSAVYHLMFLGRMDPLKGGRVFLDALPIVASRLKKRLAVHFIGDGPERVEWEAKAMQVSARYPAVSIDFVGYVGVSELKKAWCECDLLVVPSLWPEPFGLVGLEAGLRGIPVAAFAVGGIPDWLSDGVNGFLAPSRPATSEGLADAIFRCLHDPATYARLQQGARETAKSFSMEKHVSALIEIFETAICG